MTSFLDSQSGPVPADRRIAKLSDSQLQVLGQVEREPGNASEYVCGQLSAWRYSLRDEEEAARIEAALDRAKRAKAKPKRKSTVQIADEAVDRALARHGIDPDDD